MIILPAIDLLHGACVRLTQGVFASERIYDADPVSRAERFAAAGAGGLHVVDLDGARAGRVAQDAVVGAVARASGLPVQAGGGVRGAEDVARLLDAGVSRVVIGSLAVRDPEATEAIVARFGADRIVVALDCVNTDAVPRVATSGWRDRYGPALWQVLTRLAPLGTAVLCTDIGRDGTLTGPNAALYAGIRARHAALVLQASGGVHALDDLALLERCGADAVVVGKALYEGAFTLEEALARDEAPAC